MCNCTYISPLLTLTTNCVAEYDNFFCGTQQNARQRCQFPEAMISLQDTFSLESYFVISVSIYFSEDSLQHIGKIVLSVQKLFRNLIEKLGAKKYLTLYIPCLSVLKRMTKKECSKETSAGFC